jgi:hypothetical protein
MPVSAVNCGMKRAATSKWYWAGQLTTMVEPANWRQGSAWPTARPTSSTSERAARRLSMVASLLGLG